MLLLQTVPFSLPPPPHPSPPPPTSSPPVQPVDFGIYRTTTYGLLDGNSGYWNTAAAANDTAQALKLVFFKDLNIYSTQVEVAIETTSVNGRVVVHFQTGSSTALLRDSMASLLASKLAWPSQLCDLVRESGHFTLSGSVSCGYSSVQLITCACSDVLESAHAPHTSCSHLQHARALELPTPKSHFASDPPRSHTPAMESPPTTPTPHPCAAHRSWSASA